MGKIDQLLEGTIKPLIATQAQPTAGAERGWVFLNELDEDGAAPAELDTIVVPEPPIAIQAGALLGHLGEYRRIHNPGQARSLLHHEIFAGPELSGYLARSRAAAAAAKPEEKTLLRIAPGTQLCNAMLANAAENLLTANTVVALDGAPSDDAVYVKVTPTHTLEWIERTTPLPQGAQDAKLYRHDNSTPFTPADLIRPPNQGTLGSPGATRYKGILVGAVSKMPVWMAKSTHTGLPAIGSRKLLTTNLTQGSIAAPTAP
ncbi:hypothetical protein ACKI2N_007635 [Cupriavidus sp. 30B13]|uniref:hypothetical protein n=1 Tax=Cupriavidus sp. 30B13 TaxID=3384241 RepID=UPI003B91B0D2